MDTIRTKTKKKSPAKPIAKKKRALSKRRLKTMADVRRFLADVINKLNRDEIDIHKAKGLGYLCQILIKSIEGSDLENRVLELEKALSDSMGK